MKRRVLSVVAAMVGTVVIIPAASVAPAAPPGAPGTGATALLRGELVLVSDAHRGELPGASSLPHDDADSVTAHLDVDGTSVSVDPASVDGLTGGSVVTLYLPSRKR